MQHPDKRTLYKSAEGGFIHEMLNSYELCPKISEEILHTAKEYLLRGQVLKEGQIEATVIGVLEKAGRTVEELKKKQVILTVDAGKEDIDAKKEMGRIALRQMRLQRITEEALEQQGVLSQEDLSKYLHCDIRTVRRDIQAIRKRGIEVVTRGALHNIGRGQTHKKKIIGLYLEGKFYAEIKLMTRHSTAAIKRYTESFIRVLMSISRGIKEPAAISSVTGLSVHLIKQYYEILNESKGNERRQEKIGFILSSHSREEGIKKSSTTTGSSVDPTTGGCS